MGDAAVHNKTNMFTQIQQLISSGFYKRRQTTVFILDDAQCLSGVDSSLQQGDDRSFMNGDVYLLAHYHIGNTS
jgi:hypothetical protein